MYLVLCKAEKTMIPCAEVMWLTNDLYKCVILREDIDQNKYTHFVAHGKDIFTIVDSILLNTLIRSQKESQESVETFDFVTLNMENSPQIWAVYKGGLFTPYNRCNERYFVQFDIPEGILSHMDFAFVNDPVVPFGRIKVRPLKYPRKYKLNYKTSSELHDAIEQYINNVGPATTFQVAEGLDIPISSTSGRISELVRDGRIQCVNHDYSTGNRRKMWGSIHNRKWV